MMLKTGIFFGKPQRYLCVETSGIPGFISLFLNQKKEEEYVWASQHSEKLVQNLQNFQKRFSGIQFIAVNYGPGRFTGIRLGVNFAKTLAYYLSCPLYPCCSLRIMAQPYLEEQNKPVLCLMEAFSEKFYIGIYQNKNQQVKVLLEAQAISKNELNNYIQDSMVVVGNMSHLESVLSDKKQLVVYSDVRISSKHFSSTVMSDFDSKDLKKWDQLEPLYIRVPGVLK